MNSHNPASRAASTLEQVYLVERDAALLCRVLGLYASHGVDVLHVDYAYAAQQIMKLSVSVAASLEQTEDTEEAMRAVVNKASALVGVLAACEQPAAQSWAA